MAVSPNTDLFLLKCPLEVDNLNQIDFASASAQYNYFSSLPKLEGENFTYQRKDSIIRFPAHIDTLLEYTYVMYRNTNYGTKWFYAFITDMQYINDNMTAITIKTDCWQTWCFDITLDTSFVEREHVADDTIGLHTLNEEIATSEYMINSVTNKTLCAPADEFGWIVLAVTEPPTKDSDGSSIVPATITSRCYNGVVQGCTLFLWHYTTTGLQDLQRCITWYDEHSKNDAITSLYVVPRSVYPDNYLQQFSIIDPFGADITIPISHIGATDMGTTTIPLNATLNGYTPKNNKMFCYPYNYLMVTNNTGNNSIYHYEDFSSPSSIQFKYNGVLTEGADVKAYPVNYKKNTTSLSGYAYGIDMGKCPTFSWDSDLYLNWKAQNSWQGFYNQAGNVTNTFNSMPTQDVHDSGAFFNWMGNLLEQGGNYIGTSISAIKNSITGAGYQASLTPDQENGQTTGDLNFSIGRSGFTFYQLSIRAEVAAIVDNYFSMYGYKVSTMKNIAYKTRSNWNYVKCSQTNIIGNIPQADMQSIKNMFNTGVTFWHNPLTFLDYSQTNSIVS